MGDQLDDTRNLNPPGPHLRGILTARVVLGADVFKGCIQVVLIAQVICKRRRFNKL